MVHLGNDGVFANHLFFAKRLNLWFGYQANAGIKATPLWDSFVITCSLPWYFSFKFIKESIHIFFVARTLPEPNIEEPQRMYAILVKRP